MRQPRAHAWCAGPIIISTALALTLAGCGGASHTPLLPEASGSLASDAVRTQSDGLIRMADTALRTGDTNQAVRLYEEAALIDSGNLEAILGLGSTLLSLGRAQEAVQAFERALELRPESVDARYGYARAMLGINRPEVAVEHLQAALAASSSDVRLHNAMGVTLDLLGEHAQAIGAYRKGLALAPTSVPLRNNLGLSLALAGEFDAAIATLRALAQGPESTRRTRQNLALVYGLRGDLVTAERLSRADLGDDEVRDNLAFYRALSGLPDSPSKAAAVLRQPLAHHREESPTRVAATAAPVTPPLQAAPPATAAPAPATPKPRRAKAPKPLTPAVGKLTTGLAVDDIVAPGTRSGAWLVNLGTYPDAAAASARWQALQRSHPEALRGTTRLAGAGTGQEPLMAGPLADRTTAVAICAKLNDVVPTCEAVSL